MDVFWFIPTHGDSRYLGTSRGARAAGYDYFRQVAVAADTLGYDGVLLPTGRSCEDAWVVASSLIGAPRRLKFLVAIRPGVSSPQFSARMAATFDLLAAALVAGLPPGQAVSTVAAALPPGRRAPLQHVAVMLDLSAEPRTVWEVLANDESLGPLGRAMLRTDDSGAPIADGLQVLANDARQAARTERLERARRVGVRTAARLPKMAIRIAMTMKV